MKILFAVQGTGNGHISRARDIIPILKKYGSLDIAVSGTQADVSLDYPILYRFYGFSFIFGTKGGVDQWKTLKQSRLGQLWKDIRTAPVEDYDLIINDFEPVIAWACKWKKIPCIGLSHQSAFLSPKTPRPHNSWNWAEWVLKYYAPIDHAYAFHFESYDDFIYTPVIREEVRALESKNEGHYTVYLPAYGDDQIFKILEKTKEVRWEVFSKHSHKPYIRDHVFFKPIENHAYNDSLSRSAGLLTGGGFEGPAEALFLGKKIFSIPMKGQWEQQCNSAALEKMGVPVSWKGEGDLPEKIRDWVLHAKPIQVNFPNLTESILEELINNYRKSVSFT